MKKYILIAVFILGLIYILFPGPSSINDFPQLSNSLKSKEEGDTTQIPNVKAYYSFLRREEITKLYKDSYEKKSFGFLNIPAIKLNHPPEYAYTYVRDQLQSTFLEEYTYPLRDSLFVNGFDRKIYNDLIHLEHSFQNDTIHIDGVFYNSKTTLRFYPSSPLFRVLIYIGIWWALILLFSNFKNNLKAYR